jgi:hypothetical protein
MRIATNEIRGELNGHENSWGIKNGICLKENHFLIRKAEIISIPVMIFSDPLNSYR